MNEIGFVHKLRDRIREDHEGALIIKPNDQKTVGIPDLLAFWSGTAVAVEAKVARGVPRNREALWLDHDFTGPQVVTLQQLARNGIPAVGLINVASNGEVALVRARDLRIGMSFSYVGQVGIPFPLEREHGRILDRIITIANSHGGSA
jgi:hypothetical protein